MNWVVAIADAEPPAVGLADPLESAVAVVDPAALVDLVVLDDPVERDDEDWVLLSPHADTLSDRASTTRATRPTATSLH